MRYARILSIGLLVTVAFAWSAAAVENAHELAGDCQSLERGVKGAGRHIYIPRTRDALICWGNIQAMQDLSVLVDENGHRIMGACPPEQMTTLQLIRLFVRYTNAHRSETSGQCCSGGVTSAARSLPVPRCTRRLNPGAMPARASGSFAMRERAPLVTRQNLHQYPVRPPSQGATIVAA
jgi:hypothetical protein